MKKKQTGLIVFIIIFAVIVGGAWFLYNRFTGLSNSGNNLTEMQEGGNLTELQEAPDFTVYDGDGNEVKLSEKIGKPIVLNFWASWCPPCKKEMPHFEEVYKDMGDEVEFMMVDAVGGKETSEKGKEHIEKEGFTFPVYFDEDEDAVGKYGVTTIPVSVFINKDGYIVAVAKGSIDKASLLRGIDLITDTDMGTVEEQPQNEQDNEILETETT